MNLNIGSKKDEKKTFELVIAIRDRNGKTTGSTKSYSTDDPIKLDRFWLRNSNLKKKKKKTKAASSSKEINDGLTEAEKYTKIIRRKRKLED